MNRDVDDANDEPHTILLACRPPLPAEKLITLCTWRLRGDFLEITLAPDPAEPARPKRLHVRREYVIKIEDL